MIGVDHLIGGLLVLLGLLLMYLQAVVMEEEKRGKHIPLFWERKFWRKK